MLFGRLLFAQPSTSLGTLTLTFLICSAKASLLRLPFHARIPPALKKGFSVCGGLSRPQHLHSFTKKSFLYTKPPNAFFTSLGVFIVIPHTNVLRLFAHFFRRMPRGIYLKNRHYFLAFFQKNRAPNESLSAKTSDKFNVSAFLLVIMRKKQIFYYFYKGR